MKFMRLSLPVFAALAITFSLVPCAQAQTVAVTASFNSQFAEFPSSPVQATDGNFYGVAAGGLHGEGVIYRMTPDGKLSSLYSFCAQYRCADGRDVTASPILGSDGKLY